MQESHNIIPATIRARNSETGQWEVLEFYEDAWFYGIPVAQCYCLETCEEPISVDLGDYESFEAV